MKSVETLLRLLDDPTLSYDEQVRRRCHIAAELEDNGQYEEARAVLADWWQDIGQRPKLEGLSELTAAELLLRAGTLSSWFGRVRQIRGAQETAKNLINESIRRFHALGEMSRAAGARSDLGYCYRREGEYDNARVNYTEALTELAGKDKELEAKILLRLATVESSSGQYHDALRTLTGATPTFEVSTNAALKGKFHNVFGLVLMFLGKAERRADFTDRALAEFTEAAYYFKQSGHISYLACTENNFGLLLYPIGRYAEAHEHLNRARRLFISLNDSGSIAQVDETRARALLTEGRAREAARVIAEAVRTLSKGDEHGILTEALTTQGCVLARLGDFSASQYKLHQAADLAEQSGAVEDAGKALLTLMEEHAGRLDGAELLTLYERADALLDGTQDAETIGRLRACARRVTAARRAAAPPQKEWRSRVDFWANFSLVEKVRAYEARYIRRALSEAHGSISRAARLLGFKHHASLASLLRGRHKNLSKLRTPPEKRRRSIMRGRGVRKEPQIKTSRPATAARILHVEDNKLVADAAKEMLEIEGWSVETISEGDAALRQLASDVHYDLLVLDNELPGASGVELARQARQLPHRRHTPVIMLSASNNQAEAERAGVDAFLQKPDDVRSLVATIKGLLAAASEG